MDVVGHEAPGPDADTGVAHMLRQKGEVGAIIVVAEEDGLPSVTALRDMMRHGRDDDASEAGHLASVTARRRLVNLVLCPRITARSYRAARRALT